MVYVLFKYLYKFIKMTVPHDKKWKKTHKKQHLQINKDDLSSWYMYYLSICISLLKRQRLYHMARNEKINKNKINIYK